MRLVRYAAEDLWLTVALECDPKVMRHLGGPMTRESIPPMHAKRVAYAEAGGWWFKIVTDDAPRGVGTVGIWETEREGETIVEMGWSFLPSHQGRGLGTEAARQVVERARAEKKCASIHAFPPVSNAASNAICRKTGFVRLGEVHGDYAGRPLACAHWRLDL